jgi:DNA polymerase-3 subunit epsilon
MTGMNLKKKYWVLIGLYVLGFTALLALVVWGAVWRFLSPRAQSEILSIFADNFGLIFLVAVVALIGQLFLLNEIFQNYIVPLYWLREEALLIAGANPGHRIRIEKGSREIQDVAEAINSLAGCLSTAQEQTWRSAERYHEEMKERLGLHEALLDSLPHGVVACTLSGEILAYNRRAGALFTPSPTCGSSSCGLLGLHRSLRRVLPDASPLDRVLAEMQGEQGAGSEGVREFTCPGPGDRLFHVRLAPLAQNGSIRGCTLVIHDLGRDVAAHVQARHIFRKWPMAPCRPEELLQAAAQGLSEGVLRLEGVSGETELWIEADEYPFVVALRELVREIGHRSGTQEVRCRVERDADDAVLVLFGLGSGPGELTQWRERPIATAAGGSASLRIEDVLLVHGMRVESRTGKEEREWELRLRMPLVSGRVDLLMARAGTEPERRLEVPTQAQAEAACYRPDSPLTELTYTVFDTETTGLNPQAGDEIISLSAVRIVNGRLQPREIFNQLIDPGRIVPEESIGAHGIRPEMLEGQPRIEEVLPLFLEFAANTVLVAHNAVFDLEFLRGKETDAGLRIDNPVLDTALLAAALKPHQKDHGLEATAKRLGVAVRARHTSYGDAVTTARVWLKLIPLLASQGVHTLEQACLASQRVYASPQIGMQGQGQGHTG